VCRTEVRHIGHLPRIITFVMIIQILLLAFMWARLLYCLLKMMIIMIIIIIIIIIIITWLY